MNMQSFVLDSSVLIAAIKPTDTGHADAVDLLHRLQIAQANGRITLLAPPELWLEVRVAIQKLPKTSGAHRESENVLDHLPVELVPITSVSEIDAFFDALKRFVRDRPPFSNATDLAYLWVAWHRNATLITFDAGLLKYNGMVCDVMRPFHVRLD
jgi:predicted nucleic acid-binding protein